MGIWSLKSKLRVACQSYSLPTSCQQTWELQGIRNLHGPAVSFLPSGKLITAKGTELPKATQPDSSRARKQISWHTGLRLLLSDLVRKHSVRRHAARVEWSSGEWNLYVAVGKWEEVNGSSTRHWSMRSQDNKTRINNQEKKVVTSLEGFDEGAYWDLATGCWNWGRSGERQDCWKSYPIWKVGFTG